MSLIRKLEAEGLVISPKPLEKVATPDFGSGKKISVRTKEGSAQSLTPRTTEMVKACMSESKELHEKI